MVGQRDHIANLVAKEQGAAAHEMSEGQHSCLAVSKPLRGLRIYNLMEYLVRRLGTDHSETLAARAELGKILLENVPRVRAGNTATM